MIFQKNDTTPSNSHFAPASGRTYMDLMKYMLLVENPLLTLDRMKRRKNCQCKLIVVTYNES